VSHSVTCDPLNDSLLDGLSDAARQNIALLLDRLDARFMYQIELLRTQIGGKMTEQRAGSQNREERLRKLENCPCAVHRDPVHNCMVLDISAQLARIEAKVDATVEEKLSPLKLKLAYILGGLGLLAVLLDLAARVLPIFWR
jgi:hypothetical protein